MGVVEAENAKVERWLGVKDRAAAEYVLYRAGVLAVKDGTTWKFVSNPESTTPPVATGVDSIAFWHVWLQVKAPAIGIGSYWNLDPSWKYREVRAAAPPMGRIEETRFLTEAFFSQTARRSPLEWYQSRLSIYLSSQASPYRGTTSLADIPYAGSIIAKNFTSPDVIASDYTTVPTNSEYTPVASNEASFTDPAHVTADDIDFRARIHVNLTQPNGNTVLDEWITSDQLDTDLLSVRYFNSAPHLRTQLYAGEVKLAEQGPGVTVDVGDAVSLTLSVYRGGSATAISSQFEREAGQPIALMLNADQFSHSRINELQGELLYDPQHPDVGSNAILAAGAISADQSMVYQSRLLELIAAKYASEMTLQRQKISDLTHFMVVDDRLEFGVVTGIYQPYPDIKTFKYLANPIFYYANGRGITVDLPGNILLIFPLEGTEAGISGEYTASAIVYTDSYLESSVLEELTHTEAVSTVKGFQWVMKDHVLDDPASPSVVTEIDSIDKLEDLLNLIPTGQVSWFIAHPNILAQWADDVLAHGATDTISTNNGFSGTFTDSDSKSYTLAIPNRLVEIGDWTGAVWTRFGREGTNNIGYIINDGVSLSGGAYGYSKPAAAQKIPDLPFDATNFIGDPVQPFTGVLVHDEPLIALATPGLPLSFTLHFSTEYQVGQRSELDSGTATGGNNSSLTDNSRAWSPNQWQNKWATILATDGKHHSVLILSNTATTITYAVQSWTPAANSPYLITVDSYNPDYYEHGFGRGWRFSYGDFLDVSDAQNQVVWFTATGQRYVFKHPSRSLKYENAAGHYGTMSRDVANQQYTYTENGSTYVFDKTGRLSSIQERNGNRVALSYYGNTFSPKQAIYISSDTSVARQTISFGQGGDGNITTVTAPGPDFRTQTWSLEYQTGTDGRRYLTAISLKIPKNPTFVVQRSVTTYDYFGLRSADALDQRNGALKTITRWLNGGVVGTQEYDYYPNGRAFSTRDPSSHTEYFSYDQFISQEIGTKPALATAATLHTDYNGNVSKTIYTDDGNLDRTINPDGSETYFVWEVIGSAPGNFVVSASHNEIGLTELFSYSTNGKVEKHISNANASSGSTVTEYTYDKFANLKTITVGGTPSRVTVFDRDDGNGNLNSVTDAALNVTNYTYTASGQIKTRTTPLGSGITADVNPYKTFYSYDSNGMLDKTTQTLGTSNVITTVYDYDLLGNLLKLTTGATLDQSDSITVHQYDVYGRERATIVDMNRDGVDSTHSADDLITRSDYNIVAGPVSTDPNDVIDFHLEKITRVGRRKSESNPESVIEAGNDFTRTVEEYDPLNRVVISALNQAVGTTTYDGNGNVIAVEDALHNVTHYIYDNRDRKTQTLLPDGGFARTLYDGAGRAVKTSTPRNGVGGYALDAVATTVSEFNDRGLLFKVDDAVGQEQRYHYNAFGEVDRVESFLSVLLPTEPVNTVWNTKIDELGRVIEQRSSQGLARAIQYDPDGNIIVVSDYLVDGVASFTTPAKLTLSTRPARTTTTRYDSLGRAIAVRDAAGNITRTIYDKAGRIRATFDARGTASMDEATFDNFVFSADATAPASYKTSFEYDPAGRLIKKTLPDLVASNVDKLTYTHYRDGRAKTQTSVSGNARLLGPTYSYDYANSVPGNPLGALRVTQTDPFGKTQITDSDLSGRVVASTDERGHTTTYQYDSMGRKIVEKLPPVADGGIYSARITTYTYDQGGHLAAVTDETEIATSPRLRMEYEHDEMGREVLQTAMQIEVGPNYTPLSQTSTTYNQPAPATTGDGRNTVTSTDGRGIVTTTITDYNNQIPGQKRVRTFSGSNLLSIRKYNSWGDLTRSTEYQNTSLQRTTSYAYDAIGQVTKTILPSAAGQAPDARSMSYTYDKAGNVLTETDALGHVTSHTYDAQNRKLVEMLPVPSPGAAAPRTTYAYDKGVMQSMTDPAGNVTSYTYDALDRVKTESTRVWLNPNQTNVLVTTSYSYDDAGNVKQIIDRNGQGRSFAYDNLNRLRSEVPSADTGGRPDTYISYDYDQQGRITDTGSERSFTTGMSYDYDALGRVVESVTGDATEMLYSYDLGGNRTKLITKWGGDIDSTIYYDYNALNYLKNILQISSEGLIKGMNFKYLLSGEKTRTFRYNGGTVNTVTGDISLSSPVGGTKNPKAGVQVYNYDGAGRLAGVSFGAEPGMTYAYDNADRITNMTVFGVSRSYRYDDTDQLTLSSGSGASGNYSYDSNFNRTSNNSMIGAGNRLKSDGQWNYEYDGNGNRIVKTNFAGTTPAKSTDVRITSTYDLRNQLTKLATSTFVATGQPSHITSTTYTHNTEGRVSGRFVDPGDGISDWTFYAYDGPNSVLAIGGTDDPPLVTRYLYGLNEDEILAWDTKLPGSSTFTGYWLMADHQGSVRREVKDNGTIARRIDYDEFGNILGDKGFGPSPDHKYTGQIWDDSVAMYDYGARFYDPKIGRFINQDPAGQGTNVYAYTFNNPMNMVDPTGMEAFGGGGFSGASHPSSSPLTLGGWDGSSYAGSNFSWDAVKASVSKSAAGASLTLAQDYAQPHAGFTDSKFDLPLPWTQPADIDWHVAMRESIRQSFLPAPTHLTPASYSGPIMRAMTPQEVAYNNDPNVRFMNDMFMQGGPQNEGQANGMLGSSILLQNNYSVVGSLRDAGHAVAPELAMAYLGIRGTSNGSTSFVMNRAAENRIIAMEETISRVQINRSRGNAFRDMVADQFRSANLDTVEEKRVSPFLSNGRLANDFMMADIVVSLPSGAGVFETKLTPKAPFTRNQRILMPLLQQNGGVVRTTGEYIPPGATRTVYGPDLSNPWDLHP